MSPQESLYRKDFHSWCFNQANMIREKLFDELDIENLAEEVESVGRSEESELENRLAILISHLLKWKYQPDRQSKSWAFTVREQRKKVMRLLKKNPSLKSKEDEAFESAYSDAVMRTEKVTKLDIDIFPEKMPFSQDDVLKEGWLPE
jgi:hypothetical protein